MISSSPKCSRNSAKRSSTLCGSITIRSTSKMAAASRGVNPRVDKFVGIRFHGARRSIDHDSSAWRE